MSRFIREIVTLSDGGEVACDWGTFADSDSKSEDSSTCEDSMPVLLILAGITGCSADNYIQHLVEDGLLQGYRPVVLNQRGTGGLKLKVIMMCVYFLLIDNDIC